VTSQTLYLLKRVTRRGRREMWRFVLAAALGLLVGATGRANAMIVTYTFESDPLSNCGSSGAWCVAEGYFWVDSAHFTVSNLGFTFDEASGFLPQGVTVTPAGNLTKGPCKNVFEGNGVPLSIFGPPQLTVETEDSLVGIASLTFFDGINSFAPGVWSNEILLGESVPEPATWALFGVGALMLMVYGQRQRKRAAKIAFAV
jgi:hypothetical protein